MKDEILETLEAKRDYYNKMASMCDDILNGKSMKSVCESNGMTVPTFRGRVFRNEIRPTNKISKEDFMNSVGRIMSPEERIFQDIISNDRLFRIKPNQTIDFPEDFEETLLRLIDEVADDRTRDIIRLRYYEDMSLSDIGKEFGLTLERIRQILIRLFRNLGRSDRFMRLLYGDKEYSKYQKNTERCAYVESLLKNRIISDKKREIYDSMVKELDLLNEQTYPSIDPLRNIETLNLDIRTFNALKRSGVNTIDDVLKLTDAELLKTRNFGLNCLANLNDALAKFGLTRG